MKLLSQWRVRVFPKYQKSRITKSMGGGWKRDKWSGCLQAVFILEDEERTKSFSESMNEWMNESSCWMNDTSHRWLFLLDTCNYWSREQEFLWTRQVKSLKGTRIGKESKKQTTGSDVLCFYHWEGKVVIKIDTREGSTESETFFHPFLLTSLFLSSFPLSLTGE